MAKKLKVSLSASDERLKKEAALEYTVVLVMLVTVIVMALKALFH